MSVLNVTVGNYSVVWKKYAMLSEQKSYKSAYRNKQERLRENPPKY